MRGGNSAPPAESLSGGPCVRLVKPLLSLAVACVLMLGGVVASASEHNRADAETGKITKAPSIPSEKIAITSGSGTIGYCIWWVWKPQVVAAWDVQGYAELDCSNASTTSIKVTVCNEHLTWPFWIRNNCDSRSASFGDIARDVHSCTNGQHDWRSWAHFEVWFTGNTYGSAQPYSATPNPQFTLYSC